MKVFHRCFNIPKNAQRGVVAIGNFDGLHKGHMKLLRIAEELARKAKLPFNVLTFEPHPLEVFNPENEAFRITPVRSKVRILSDLKVDNLIIMHFISSFYKQKPAEFVKNILFDCLHATHVVVGEEYHFGQNQQGNVNTLKKLGKTYGFDVTVVSNITNEDGDKYSSSLVRFFLKRGDIAEANKILGHEWEIEARVVSGQQLGRVLGFPTANLNTGNYVMPRMGVYAAKVAIPYGRNNKFRWYEAVMNYGLRPTVDGKHPVLEVHILGFHSDIYGKRIRIRPLYFLRPELKMSGIEQLKKTIKEDTIWTKIIFAKTNKNDIKLVMSNAFLKNFINIDDINLNNDDK